MITIDRGLQLSRNGSAVKFLKYLGKTNQDLVVVPRRPNQPPKAGTAQTREALVKPVVANVDLQNSVSHDHLIECPSGSLIGNWTRENTIFLKKYLSAHQINVESLVRSGDLGIRSAKGTAAIGVILSASYNLLNDQSRRQRSMKCYVIPYTQWIRIESFMQSVHVGDAEVFILTASQGIAHVNLSRK